MELGEKLVAEIVSRLAGQVEEHCMELPGRRNHDRISSR